MDNAAVRLRGETLKIIVVPKAAQGAIVVRRGAILPLYHKLQARGASAARYDEVRHRLVELAPFAVYTPTCSARFAAKVRALRDAGRAVGVVTAAGGAWAALARGDRIGRNGGDLGVGNYEKCRTSDAIDIHNGRSQRLTVWNLNG